MKIRLKRTVKYTMSGVAESHSCTRLSTRDLTAVSDEPFARGGTNKGFAPTEMVMAGLVSCTSVIAHKVAKQNGVSIDSMAIDLELTFNQLGVNLQEEVDLPFEEIRMTVDIASPASPEDIQKLAAEVAKFCAVSKILRQSGTKIVDIWNLKPAPADSRG